jgi:NADH-quinone oxidoreductase subunit E
MTAPATTPSGVDLAKAREIVDALKDKEGTLIQMLQEIQYEYGYFPPEAVELVADGTGTPPVRIYGILTFYAQFRLAPPGRHTIKVCQGTACHVMGGKQILDYLVDTLGVSPGQTTADGSFSFERVACVGCCGMAPVVLLDGKAYGNSTIKSVDELLKRTREEDGGDP